MKTTWLGFLGLIVAGCSGIISDRPSRETLHDGLNLIDIHDAAWGLDAAFVGQGRVVYLETRVGPLKPLEYRQAFPADPRNEIDLRFVDQAGNTFYVQRGGDSFVDAGWDADIDAARQANLQPTATERELDWSLARQAAAAFVASVPAGYHDHAYHMVAFAARPVPSQDPSLQAKAARITQTQFPQRDSAYSFAYGGWSWLETDLYTGCSAYLLWTCVGHHSATIMWDYEYGIGWVAAVNACNHGRCAGDSTLSYAGYTNGGWFWNTSISGESGSSTSVVSGGCQTAYNWNAPPGHCANDDAAYELWQAKNGSRGGTSYGTAGDGMHFHYLDRNSNDFDCDCTYGGCNGNWSTPAIP